MNSVSDLMKELYIVKMKAEAGEDFNSAFAQMQLPIADIDETKNSEDGANRKDSEETDVIQTLIEQLRGQESLHQQDVYPVDDIWYAKITDGSITRTYYSQGNGQYSDWSEVTLTADPGEEVLTNGRTGDDKNILVDINQHDSLPNNTVVRVVAFSYADGTLYYYFSWEGWGTKASPKSIHTDPTTDDNLTWDAESPGASEDGKTTRYSNAQYSINAGAPGDVTLHICYWDETADSEGHDRIVGDETHQAAFWDADNVYDCS